MATSIPPKLKTADIARFAFRAAQLEKAKPVVAYWCNYWIVNQILSQGLHNSDDESLKYTTALMDKLEQFKADNADNDAVLDDVAGHAYVEQFGLETFQRADNAVRANKASRQTADTFQAAATFLELNQIWGDIDSEIAAKIKFAKYHALRIAKALKAGEDPNLSNPTPESEQNQEPALDPNDPEVQMLTGSNPGAGPGRTSRHASVEDVPDEHDRLQPKLAQRSSLDESLHPSRASSVPRPAQPSEATVHAPNINTRNEESYYTSSTAPAPEHDVSPLGAPPMDQHTADGPGYFPQVPSPLSQPSATELPSVPSDIPAIQPTFGIPDSPAPAPPPTFDNAPSNMPPPPGFHPGSPPPAPEPSRPEPMGPPDLPHAPMNPHQNIGPPPIGFPNTGMPVPTPPFVPQQSVPHRSQQPVIPQPPHTATTAAPVDEAAVMLAQKHARWAISALNFEDIPTAVRELQNSLRALGA